MLNKILDFSLNNKFIIILFTLSIVIFGTYSVIHIPVGAVPDITNNQVQVITTSGNLSTQEIEQFITAPVEIEMANLPGVQEIRSVSKFGLSVVTVVFSDEMGTYLPRQLIVEKIESAAKNIPDNFGRPEMGPITTGLGEIYQYSLDIKPGYEGKYTAMDLRTIQDWVVKRRLSGIPGVVEINSWGGFLKQYEIAIDPVRLKAVDITLMEVFDALESNNSISGGSYLEKTNQAFFIRGDGQVKSIEDIENIVVANRGGVPLLLKDIADVGFGFANRFGAITSNGKGETVLGQVMMLKDANSKEVINEVKARVAEIQGNLPEGVFINPILERSELIGKTSTTIAENLILGAIIVMLIVILLLGNFRSALVITSMIPLSLLFTISAMYVFGVDANLMSLGALDFGIIIDGAVIIVEYIALRMMVQQEEISSSKGKERSSIMTKISFEGASKMMKSAIFGQVIILIVFIPILSLTGVEGKMFRPMALSFSFALIGAMILGLTWLPVAASLFLKPIKSHKKNISDWIMDIAYKSYYPVIKWSSNHKKAVLGAAVLSLILTGVLFSKMGGEFVPTLDEGDFVIQPVLKTGTSLTKTVEMCTQMENILLDKFPEVDQVLCRIGAAEVPTDPMSMEEIDMIIKLNPIRTWENAKTKDELAERFKEELSIIPGIEYEFTQPIEMRFNELITGVRSDIAIKVFGDDLDYINKKAMEVKALVMDVPGADDVILEKTAGLPQIKVDYNRQKIAYYGLDIKTLNSYLSAAFGGEIAGIVFEGEKRFDMVVRFQKQNRGDIEDIRKLYVPLENGQQIPLEELADIQYSQGPAKISRENTQRRVVVSVNVRNRDLQSVVTDIQAKVDANVELLPGTYISYGGQFENLRTATERLIIAVPIALALIFVFLYFAFKSLKDTLLIFTAIPLATVGGVVFLWLRDMPFSVSAGVGFIALFGIAVLNGIVLIEHLKDLQKEGMKNMKELIFKGTKDRLRPVMLTAGAAAMGFLPMAISTGAGAEVQRPLATVVIGGLFTSTMLTLIALPILFEIFYSLKKSPKLNSSVKKSAIGVMVIIFFSSSSMFAQKNILDLNQISEIAISNNREIKAYNIKAEQSEVLVKTSFELDKTLVYYGFDQNNIAKNGYPLSILGIEQDFKFPTLYSAKKKSNKINVSIADVNLEIKTQSLKKEISNCYYQIQYFENKLIIYTAIDSLYSKLLTNAEIRNEKGNLSQLDLLNIKAKQNQSQLSLKAVDYNIEKWYQKLKVLMNYYEEFYIATEIEILTAQDNVIEESPSVMLLELQNQYSEANVSIEKNKRLPDISLAYYVGSNTYDNAQNYNGFQVGLALPLGVWSDNAKVKSAKLEYNAQQLITQNEILLLNTKYQEIKNSQKQYKDRIDYYYASGKQLHDEILRVTIKSLSSGQIDFFKFVYGYENAIKIKLDYLDSVLEYNKLMLDQIYLTN